MTIRTIASAMLLLPAALAFSDKRPELTEKFEQTYPLSDHGRVALKNLNGGVSITAWDRAEVKVEATKRAYTPARLAEAKIVVEASKDAVLIRTQYPESADYWKKDLKDPDNPPATVEYHVTVPRAARLDKIEVVNSGLELEGIAGTVEASTVNGSLEAKALMGEVKLSTVNGRLAVQGLKSQATLSVVNGSLEATCDQLGAAKQLRLESVNSSIVLRIPAQANARFSARTVNGSITNEFDWPLKLKKRFVGQELEAALGSGGPQIDLSTVNGSIAIRRAEIKAEKKSANAAEAEGT